jgi:ketosteroid isomerase-like protein
MKKILAISVFVFGLNVIGFAQSKASDNSTEEIIRNLEMMNSQAVLSQDIDILDRLWTEDFMVNNPRNFVLKGKSRVLEAVKSGVIHYSSFEVDIETIMLLRDFAIVMGQETVTPIGNAPNAGRIINRRYTHIWKLDSGDWRLQARHANIICED